MIKQAIILGELPVVAEEGVEAETEADFVTRRERLFEDQVILVALPPVGQAVGEDAEVAVALGRPVRVAGVAVLNPAANLDGRVLDAQEFGEEICYWGRCGRSLGLLDFGGNGFSRPR